MSDDEGGYGYGSPYDDFEDMLYDADPNPELADDLAEHVAHSPVYQDDPGYEILEYHSDWEYYSDDYFDDDPVLLKHNPQDGSQPGKPRSKTDSERQEGKRGKKRKLAEVENIPALDLGERKHLKDCIKGTVWARPIPERNNLYQEGKHGKVALLKDWRKKFGTQVGNGEKGKSRPPLQHDESWANDMSLADMGLLSTRGGVMGQEAGEEGTEAVEEEDALDYDEDQDIDGALSDGEEVIVRPKVVDAFSDTSPPPTNSHSAPTAQNDLHIQEESDTSTSRRKRRKHIALPSPPTSASQELAAVDLAVASAPNDKAAAPSAASIRSKKRKASEEPEPESNPDPNADTAGGGGGGSKFTASSRAKRIASSMTAGAPTVVANGKRKASAKEEPLPTPPPPPTRTTRSRKKA